MSVVTLGRRPTFGEVIDYYTREAFVRFLIDVCRVRQVVMVIPLQKHWEPNWVEDEVHAGTVDQVRHFVTDKILTALPGLSSSERPAYYPSFHQSVWKGRPGQLAGDNDSRQASPRLRDCAFESDVTTWRDAFQDVYAIVDRMDRHCVRYRLKFSGHRSLHVVLPAEVLPETYRGKGTIHLAKRLLSWGDSSAHHLPQITRMSYSLNEDTGLVCLPIARGALPLFRPWQANLHLVEIRRDAWQQELDDPAVEQGRVVALLEEIQPRESGPEDSPPRAFYVPDRAQIRSRYDSRLQELGGSGPVGQAWGFLSGDAALSERALQEGLDHPDPDARWLTIEAYLLKGTTLSRETFLELLEQDEEYVRPAARDVLLRFEDKIFCHLVDMMDSLDSHPTTGAKASQLLTLNPSLRNRVIEAILERTERSNDALIAAACLAGAMMEDWSGALEIAQPIRESEGLSQREKTRLSALDLMSQLGGRNKREEARRSQALADLGPETTDLLLIASGSPNRRFRRSVVSALADVADARAAELLIHSLGDEFSQVRRKAIPGLIRIGEPAVDALIEAAASDQVPVRRYALFCLVNIGAPRARPTLLQGLDDGEECVRQQAVKGLNGLATAEDIERLKRVMREDTWGNAQLAVEALASIGDEGRQAIRRMALEEDDPAAAHYLAQQGDPRGRETLVALLVEGGKRREAAAEYLRELRDERCIPYFAEQLETITLWHGAFIAHELGHIGTPEAVAVLIKALSRDSSHVRRGAVQGLWETKNPAAIEPLIQCFEDEDRKVRRLVADALAQMGEPAAEALERALAEGRIAGKSQQQMARTVLAKLRKDDEAAVPSIARKESQR